VGRKNFEFKLALPVEDIQAAASQLGRWSNSDTESSDSESTDTQILCGNALWKKSNRIAYLFTGQGAQYPGMLRQLYEQSPVFQQAIEQCSGELDPKLEKPIRSILFDSDDSADPLIHQTQYTQPAIFIAQYGLFKLWESYGVQPDYVLGHSIGEIAAYCATGGCSLADALKLVQARGALMQRLNSGGGMTSVAASAQRVEAIFAESRADLSIAAYNGPNQTVISGSLEQIASFVERAQAAGIKTQALKVSHAFHSKWMEPMLEEFRAVVAGLKLGVPSVEFISTVTATSAQKELASPEYWVDQVRQPVRFMQAMETLASKSVSHFIEIGPHPVLTTMSRSIDLPNTDDSTRWLSSSRRGQTDWSVLFSSLGQLFVDGYPIDWKSAEASYGRHRVSIPGYEFSNRRIWLDEMDSLVASLGESDYAVGQARNESTENRLVYKVRWRRSGVTEQSIASSTVKASTTAKEDEPKSWLILSVGDESLGKRLESQLVNRVGSVRLIRWNPLHADWGLQPSDCAGVDRIVLAAGDGTRTLGNADEVQQLCASQIDAFSKALSIPQWAKANRVFWLVTQGARLEDQQPALSPIDAPLWGGAKVASIELPEAWGGAIDTKDSQESIRRAIHLIQGDSSEDQVILIDDGLWVPRLEPLSVAPARKETTDSLLGHRVVITGGLGAIGLRLAEYAVSHEVKELVLVGRNMQPTADQQQRLDQWHKSGVSVQLVAVDISSQEGIAKLAASLEGKQIDSVFHTAGIDFLSPIAKWTTDDVQRVTQAKIQGAWNLHQWSLSHPIKQFVLTSSIASIWGAPDRFLYASANAFLDALGDWRVSQKLPVTVLNFGPWADGGMADQKSLDEYRRVGMHGLDPSKTIASIGRLLQHGVAQAVITDTQWDRFASVLSARRARPFFESLLDDQSLSSSASVPLDRTETRVSAGAKTSGVAQEPWLAELSRLEKASQASELKRLVRKELSEVLKSQEERISLDRNLYRLGLDSITAVELSMRLKKSTGIAAGKWLAGEPTVESVATGLLDSLQSKLLSVAQSPKDGATATPQASVADAGAMKKNLSAPWASELESLGSQEQKRERLIDLFSRELERFIGKNGSKISGSTRMADLGLDSLGTVDFATHLRKQLGLSTPPKLMQYARLEDWIESVIAPRIDRSVPVNAPSVSDAIRVELYESNMHDSVINFCNQAWPTRSGELVKQRWDWMFLKSAERLGVSPAVWIARERSAIIGHMGSQFTTLKTPRGKVVVPWLVDTMILEQYRQKGIGSQILLQAEEDMPIALSLGQTPEIRKILDSLGWKQICPLHIHVFMNRPDRVLRGKLPMGVDRLAGAYMTLSGARRRALQASRSQEIQVRRVERFDSSHDALWEQMSKGVSCLAVRDSSYLNWKYVEQPGQSYDCWEVWHTDKLIGVLVTRIEEPSKSYAYRRLHWVDVACSLEPDVLNLVIHGCIAKSTELGVDAISALLTHESIEQRLVAQGFVSRPHTRYLYASGGLVESYPGLDASRWLVTHGDSDIDRPE
jgi:malonyl CoA-acyl carrier protein transacylase/short-subunit dehydrogenase/acyl carrier protein